MRRASLLVLALSASVVAWSAACGGDDGGGVTPAPDAGADVTTTPDGDVPIPDAGADTGDGAVAPTGWIATTPLSVGRRSLGLVAGSPDGASRFLYAVGGEGASGVPIGAVEVGVLDGAGSVTRWFAQKNKLQTARSGAATVHFDRWIYIIGGTDNTNNTGSLLTAVDPLDDFERAKILDTTYAPVVGTPVASTASGALPAGTWYYRVASVGADPDDFGGESLAGNEVTATLAAGGSVTLSWPAITNATKYKVYRTQAANGASGAEVFLAEVTPAGNPITFTDDGSAVPNASEKCMVLGETGQWEQSAHVIGVGTIGRVNASAVIARAPGSTEDWIYVVGGWGRCTGDGLTASGLVKCVELAKVDPATHDLVSWEVAQNGLAAPRMRNGAAALTAANGGPGFTDGGAPANAAFLVVAGGRGATPLGAASNVEYALIGSDGKPGAFAAATTGFAAERDGLAFQIVNGSAFAFFGGTAPLGYTGTSERAAIGATASAVSLPAWSATSSNLGSSRLARHGMTSSSGVFYVAGGTTDDTDALPTVWRIAQ